MENKQISLVEGTTFSVSDELGDMSGGVCWLFAADTRLLSTYVLRINGCRLLPMSHWVHGHDAASFYLTNPVLDGMERGCLTIIRERHVNGGLRDHLTVFNYGQNEVSFELAVELASDFADIFEVRGAKGLSNRKAVVCCPGPGTLSFFYRRNGFERGVVVNASGCPEIRGADILYPLKITAKGKWEGFLIVTPARSFPGGPGGCASLSTAALCFPVWTGKEVGETSSQERPQTASRCPLPTLHTNDMDLRAAWHTAVGDLMALRMVDEQGRATVARIGRLLTSLVHDDLWAGFLNNGTSNLDPWPGGGEGTLRILASYQGKSYEPFNCEEPGKIPHEVRHGELAHLNLVPFRRYYGTVDATPLYLVLLSKVCRWTGDLALFRELLPTAEAALEWIDRYGDVDGDGFVEYVPQLRQGLRNQGWKDSHDAILFADGRSPDGPIALCEVQGYVYDAKVRLAELYQEIENTSRATQLRDQATALKRSFNEVFWMPDEGYFALALDGGKRQVNSIASNPGHCLWSGIVTEDRSRAVAERLLSRDMFSGWGVRTLSSKMRAYNPISYHNGSVWPHDCSIVAAGLIRYGFIEEAEQLIRGVLEASRYFPQHRLPELFAGYPRQKGSFPVHYPDANSPQAWAAGAVVLMTQLLFWLAPDTGVLDPNPPSAEVLKPLLYGLPRNPTWDIPESGQYRNDTW
ncbi:MAG: glycogen debranching N-terminal domain-containing protein [Dehalococcoidia bacterium]|nr:glycogen debranching N-terminal domain-containing protein [Dehalococcoidia bacterium]